MKDDGNMMQPTGWTISKSVKQLVSISHILVWGAICVKKRHIKRYVQGVEDIHVKGPIGIIVSMQGTHPDQRKPRLNPNSILSASNQVGRCHAATVS